MSTGAQPAKVIGVIGAGTMGSGIAQLACRAGARTLLHDPIPEALQRGIVRARGGLTKEAEKGRLTAEQAAAASARLEAVDGLEALAPCELVIEAAPELPELKRELYGRLSEIVSDECVLATNTSSLPVTGIAAAATHPERVVGMHFFNPAPLMRLVEVIAGIRSGEQALALADATGRAMGKTVIRAADGPGFLVNRCNRPFGLEALRLLGERVADVATIDRIVRLGGGFRMGPFELSDLVGVDTGFDVSRSFYELSFGEPRWRPSPIQARMVAAGLHGRKTGHGYYDYSGDGPHRPADPDPPPRTAGAIVEGDGPLADALREIAGDGPAMGRETAGGGPAVANEIADTGPTVSDSAGAAPRIAVSGLGGTVAGEPFHALVPLSLVEVTGDTGERAFAALGLHAARVAPSPGGVLPRMVCQVINECAFALGEGVGSAEDIDAGMTLGMNYPRGPLSWGRELGFENVLGALDQLWIAYREERFRPAPALRRLAE
ncbi:MAG TPA: 3-hydroxyacyl-CoA dehydrogenase NAD-binding domain-containing protein [Solirubrobacteraceae bacterium]|jgi:3-hydroxybutyryl-CoA dehydrogenase|nr:3-hydroxyacyl-CoA dehydrogenase NAD-binding domain-containing protein [Solirubrobacteraceae bacterium]